MVLVGAGPVAEWQYISSLNIHIVEHYKLWAESQVAVECQVDQGRSISETSDTSYSFISCTSIIKIKADERITCIGRL